MIRHNLILAIAAMLLTSCIGITPSELSCEYQIDPLIDTATPRLSWKCSSRRAEAQQSAYRIRVVQHTTLGQQTVWDSGKVPSNNSLHIRYAGQPLCSSCDYSWQVKVWDELDRESKWSDHAKWHTGKFSAAEWQAQWIGAPWQGEEPYDAEWARTSTKTPRPNPARLSDVAPAPLLRKEFEVSKRVRAARFYGTGLGYLELYMNGQRIGDEYFAPNQTNYDKRPYLHTRQISVEDPFSEYLVMYVSYDLTPYINQGTNCIGAILGNGFYDLVEYWPPMSYGTPRLFGQVDIEYSDGSHEVIATDTSWRCTKSAIMADQMFLGEHYDARKEHEGWCKGGYNDSAWESAVIRQTPCGKLVAQNGPADRITRRYRPTAVTRQEDGSWLVTFPEEISGWVALKHLNLEAGQRVDIKYICESLNGSNSYTAKGSGDESYHARFVWFVFSKVEIRGVDRLNARQIEAHAVNSDVATVAEFECSNPLLNALHKAWRRTQLDNMHGGLASDCPQRERSPYTGDGQLACQMVMHNFDAAAFYNKWIRDMRGAQLPNGYVPNSAPWQPGCGGGPSWGAAIAIIPWEHYMQYGDTTILTENYEAIKAYIAWMERWVDEDGIMESKEELKWLRLGDWIMPYKQFPHPAAAHTLAYYQCVDVAAKIAGVIGHDVEAEYYAALRSRTAKAFHRRFYNAEQQSYGKHGDNVIALRIGMPDGYQQVALDALKRNLAEVDNHFITGIVGTRHLFDVLCEMGEVDLAYTIMNKRTIPSFGYWIEQGSTTLWESWDGTPHLSRNHPMWGGGMTWFYRHLGGVKPIEAGYRTFEVAPLIPQGLEHLRYSLNSARGMIEVAWRISGSKFTLNCTVPVGTTAIIKMPFEGQSYRVGAGRHTFHSKI